MEKVFVTRSSMPSLEEYQEEIKDLWDSHWLTNMGKHHNELEIKLKKYLKLDEISLFCNGHMALELAIQAMNLKGEVITTPFTFVSTTHAIVRNGLTPIFCDINMEDYTMDVNKIESLITDKTSAIIPVHVYGNICNVTEIEKIAKKYDLKVIYDAAHAFGVEYKNRGIGTFGDASMFSFHATKVFNTIEGGAICFSNQEYGLDLYRLKNFGIRDEVKIDSIGANAKMNEFQAAMGVCNLRHIDEEIQKREELVNYYIEKLSNVEGIKLIDKQNDVKSNYSYFPVLFDEKKFGATRNDVYNELANNGIMSRKYFFPLTSDMSCYHNAYSSNNTPVATYVSKRILTLPLYAELNKEIVNKVCQIIIELKK